MKTQTSSVSRQYRLRQWAEMIRECKSLPVGMSVDEWYAAHSQKQPINSIIDSNTAKNNE